MSEVPHYDGQKLDTAQQKKLLKRLKKGDNSSVIANDFGVSRRMVNLYRQRFKLEARARGKPPHKYRFKGKIKTLKEWVEETSIPYTTLLNRVSNDWTVEEMFTIPYGHCRPHLVEEPMLSDEVMVQVWLEQQAGKSLRELADKYKVGNSYLARRLRDVRGVKMNFQWKDTDPRKSAQALVRSVMVFLKKKRLLTEFKQFHLNRIKA